MVESHEKLMLRELSVKYEQRRKGEQKKNCEHEKKKFSASEKKSLRDIKKVFCTLKIHLKLLQTKLKNYQKEKLDKEQKQWLETMLRKLSRCSFSCWRLALNLKK